MSALKKSRIKETLILLTCAYSSTNIETVKQTNKNRKEKKDNKYIYMACAVCHMSPVIG